MSKRSLFPASAAGILLLTGCVAPPSAPVVSSRIVIRSPVDAQAAAAREGQTAAAASAMAGCFSGQLGPEPWEPRAAAATVKVIAASGQFDGGGGMSEAFTGSGVVIADTADASNGHNRILTAAHVVNTTIQDNGRLGIQTSSGRLIGAAHVVARSSASGTEVVSGRSVPQGDQVVLVIDTFYPGGAAIYDRIQGVELASEQSNRIITGMFSTPAGVEGGVSGGPVFDADTGRLSALMVRKDEGTASLLADHLWHAKVNFQGGFASWDSYLDKPVISKQSVSLPEKAAGFAEPISDPGILSALGMGGFQIRTNSGQNRAVRVMGYPLGVCVLYSGTMGTGSIF